MSFKISYNYPINYNNIEVLPEETFQKEIFPCLDLKALSTCRAVSRQWNQLAGDPRLWKRLIYDTFAFSNAKWIKYCGKESIDEEDDYSSLPLNIVKEYWLFQRAFPEGNASKDLVLIRMPKILNGGLTINNLGTELLKKHFIYTRPSQGGYRMKPGRTNQFLNEATEPYWILITKNFLPGSLGATDLEKETMIADLETKSLTGYEIPKTVEAAVSIFSQYLDEQLPRIYKDRVISCIEEVTEIGQLPGTRHQAHVGYLEQGLSFSIVWKCSDIYSGAVAVKRLEAKHEENK